MSNPTTPFGWQMPTATDLVTDLPADFAVFGQAVATSMADLLGGTTGQVLSKTTNADMDFTWVASNPGDITGVTAGVGITGGGTSGDVTVTNSMATAITTNGDLIYGTGTGTFSRLGVGSTGQGLSVVAGIPAWTASATSTLTTTGDMLYASAANTLARRAIGSTGQGLTVVAGIPAWAASATSTLTTTGDMLYASAANTLARVGIGSTGNVLTVAGGVPTWAAPAGGGSSWSLLNTGGTALTGAQVITVSGISGKDKIMVLIEGASSTSAAAYIQLRINTDTTANYYQYGPYLSQLSSFTSGVIDATTGNDTSIFLARMSSQEASNVFGYVLLSGCNSSGVKIYNSSASARGQGSGGQEATVAGGYYNSSSTISSISMRTHAGTFDAGTVYVYTSAS